MPAPAFVSSTAPCTPSPAPGSSPSHGARLVAADGRELVLREVEIRATAGAGLCRVELEQLWINPYAEALRVEYQLPLPADAAVGGYRFEVDGKTTVAQIAKTADAREAFEEAVVAGHSAALLEQTRANLFSQSLGNIPPGAAMRIVVELDQPLAWIDAAGAEDEGGWEWRFPTVVAPRYLGAEGRTPDASELSVDVLDGEAVARVAASIRIEDAGAGAVHSPSHALRSVGDAWRLAEGAALDRDIVLRWPVAAAQPGLSLRRHDEAAQSFGLLTLVPPRSDAEMQSHARDLCVLLDVSGSMSGEPLAQAKRVIHALIDSLDADDQLEMIAFSSRPVRWKRRPKAMKPKAKRAALEWLAGVEVGGATEMRSGILEALKPLRPDAQRQLLIVTDGLIGFESEIVAEIRARLPEGCRVHTLGVGHGVNRALTGPAARAGRGFEAIIAPGEDVEPMLARLLARTAQPLLTELRIGGEAITGLATTRLSDLFAGAPVRIPVTLAPKGGRVEVEARAPWGPWRQELELAPGAGEAPELRRLYARERVEELDLERASLQHGAARLEGLDSEVESLGLEHQIATRMTSWIAVDHDSKVDTQAPTREVKVPHQLAAGMQAQGVGLRGAPRTIGHVAMQGYGGAVRTMMAPMAPPPPAAAAPIAASTGGAPGSADGAMPKKKGAVRRRLAREERGKILPRSAPPKPEAASADFDDMEAEAFAAAEGFAMSTLRARVLLRKDGRWVISFALEGEGALRWDPEAALRAWDAEGKELELELDATQSTRAGELSAGSVVRLALMLDDDASPPTRISIGEWEVEIPA